MIKKLLKPISTVFAAVFVIVAFIAAAAAVDVATTGAGTKIVRSASGKLGFYGTTPVTRPAATSTAFSALTSLGLIASGTDYSVQHATVSVSAAEINGMYAAPKVLVAAPGSGKSILVTKLALKITRTATQFANGGAAIVQYDSTANGAGTQALDSTIASTVITGSAGTTVTARNGAVISDSTATLNKGLYLSNATAAFDTGTGTATVDVWYVVQ